MKTTTIEKSIFLRASRAEVWAYLTQPDKLAEWFHAPKAALTQDTSFEMLSTSSGEKLIWGKILPWGQWGMLSAL